jgi:hypothetical protein
MKMIPGDITCIGLKPHRYLSFDILLLGFLKGGIQSPLKKTGLPVKAILWGQNSEKPEE